MTINLVVEVSDEVLQSVADGGTVTVRIVRGNGVPSGGGAAAPAAAPAPHRYAAGSLPDKLQKWAAERGGEFGTSDVVKALGVTRAHASMILNKVTRNGGPIRRVARGVYGIGGAAAPSTTTTARQRPAASKRTKKKRAKRKTTTKARGRSS